MRVRIHQFIPHSRYVRGQTDPICLLVSKLVAYIPINVVGVSDHLSRPVAASKVDKGQMAYRLNSELYNRPMSLQYPSQRNRDRETPISLPLPKLAGLRRSARFALPTDSVETPVEFKIRQTSQKPARRRSTAAEQWRRPVQPEPTWQPARPTFASARRLPAFAPILALGR